MQWFETRRFIWDARCAGHLDRADRGAKFWLRVFNELPAAASTTFLIASKGSADHLHHEHPCICMLRKIIKSRSHFPNDDAASKLIWLALRSINDGKVRSAREWKVSMNQLAVLHEEIASPILRVNAVRLEHKEPDTPPFSIHVLRFPPPAPCEYRWPRVTLVSELGRCYWRSDVRDKDYPCRGRYLELLKRCLTDTLFEPEPNPDHPNQAIYIAGFVNHYINGRAATMLPISRLNNLITCVEKIVCDEIQGDLIETGVWRGGATILMRALLDAYEDEKRTVWVADSFEGLPEPDPQRFPKEAAFHRGATMQRHYKKLAATIDEVRANFEMYGLLDERVQFLKGWFKDTLPRASISRLALMRLDGDYYESTMDALVNLYDKLSIGGFVIIDDYGEDAWTDCRLAVDRFREQRGIQDPILSVDSKCAFWRRSSMV